MVDKRLSKTFWSVLVIGGISLFSADGKATTHSDYLGPVDVVGTYDHKYLFVACLDSMEVLKFDLSSNAVVKCIQLSEKPTGLQLCPLNLNLFVTCGGSPGRVAVIDTRTSEITTTIQVGHTPVCPVVSPDGKRLYVCNRFNDAISVINLETLKCSKQIAMKREPIAAAITPDGKYLVVANHLPTGPADKDFIAAEVSMIDTDQYQVSSIRLPNGATGLRGVSITPDGTYAYVTLILARYQLPTTQLERGWMNTNALAVIDMRKRELLNTVLLDTITSGAANPWAVTGTADGRYLCVAHAGTHEVSVIDQPGLLKKLYVAAKKGLDEHTDGGDGSVSDRVFHYGNVPNDLRFLVGLRRRLKLAGNGPRRLTVVGTNLYAVEYFSDSLGVIDIHQDKHARARSIPLGGKKALNEIRKGQMLFHDATLCFQQWQSCASCHPDGRADALNWDLLNDGIGNPKNTRSMLLAHKTPPAMSTGVREGGEAAVRAGIRSIQFVVRPEEDARAIVVYLKDLKPIPSPYLKNGKLSPVAERGKSLFHSEQVGCARCHSGPLYTDLQQYDVGTHKSIDFAMDPAGWHTQQKEFDNPTLIEVWRTAPYLHDGRAATMKEVLTTYNQEDAHGVTSILTDQELDDLAEFVLSL